MFGLDVGDRYKKYQTLFLQVTQKNKTLAKQVKELSERVTELEKKLTESHLSNIRKKTEVDEAPMKKNRTTKTKSKRNVKAAQEQTNDRNTDTTD